MESRKKKGFTIVELVIVIGVISILIGILLPVFANLVDEAKKAKVKAELADAYTLYVTDASDGYFNEGIEGEPVPVEGAVLSQDKVALKAVNVTTDSYYFWQGPEYGWSTEARGPETGYTVTDLIDSETIPTYGGYHIYKYVNA